jgi:hypothetical protein
VLGEDERKGLIVMGDEGDEENKGGTINGQKESTDNDGNDAARIPTPAKTDDGLRQKSKSGEKRKKPSTSTRDATQASEPKRRSQRSK